MDMKNREGSKGGKSMGEGAGGDEDDEETNKDMKLFGKKRPSGFAHKKGFNTGGNKSFARKRPRKN